MHSEAGQTQPLRRPRLDAPLWPRGTASDLSWRFADYATTGTRSESMMRRSEVRRRSLRTRAVLTIARSAGSRKYPPSAATSAATSTESGTSGKAGFDPSSPRSSSIGTSLRALPLPNSTAISSRVIALTATGSRAADCVAPNPRLLPGKPLGRGKPPDYNICVEKESGGQLRATGSGPGTSQSSAVSASRRSPASVTFPTHAPSGDFHAG
jgi:hypothetical protein